MKQNLETISHRNYHDQPVKSLKYEISLQRANYKSDWFAIGTFKVKAGMAQMAKGGIVMDVINAEQARIAEEAGVYFFLHNMNSDLSLMCCNPWIGSLYCSDLAHPTKQIPIKTFFKTQEKNILLEIILSWVHLKKKINRPTKFLILFLKNLIFASVWKIR